ncbi:MAG: sugar phosphate isomerase/epimerase [Victivallales bacterium]|nr:sugar phosphate isomerase/epimerase [Victivallales bacterium]
MAQIAAQGYTIRDYMKNETDFAMACEKVKKMGYDGIQLSGHGPMDPKVMKKILDDAGLPCVVTHRGLQQMLDNPDAIIEEHKILDCPYTAIGGFFMEEEQWNETCWNEFVQKFNALGRKFAAAGLRLGYHNHSHEFAPAGSIACPLDYLIGHLDSSIWFEIDTYWVAHGMADPVEYIRRVAGRVPCIHLKDGRVTRERKQYYCEVGDGNLNWPAILEACRYAGVKWYIVERDSGELDPFVSLERSLYNLREKYGL